jgi:hypothetical protein
MARSKSSLISSAVSFLILGGIASFASGRVTCLFTECYLVISGSSIFDAKGVKLDQGVASIIQNAPIPLFGVGGAFLIAGLVKADDPKD